MDFEERNREAEERWWKWCHEQTRPEFWRPLRDEVHRLWSILDSDIYELKKMRLWVYIIYPAVFTVILLLAILVR